MSSIKEKYQEWRMIRLIMKKTGWTKEETLRRLAKAGKYGIDMKTYVTLGYWNVPEEKLRKFHRKSKRRKSIAKRVAEKHGGDPVDIERQIIEAKFTRELRIGFFEKYEWDLLSDEEKDKMFLRPQSREMSRKFKTMDSDKDIFDDKIRFNTNFPEFIRRKWFACVEMPYDEFSELIKEFHTGDFILKPQISSGGKGIEKLPVPTNDEEMRQTYDHVMEVNQKMHKGTGCFIEECIRQHPEMNRLYGDSVNTVRVVTLLLHDQFKILYAACRMGVDGNITDNASQGGMCVSVDINTGRFDTVAANKKGEPVTHHPTTGTEMLGFQIPYWDEVVQMVEKIHRKTFAIAGLGYAGWDVAIAEDGPLIIEGNNWPSPSLLQLPKYVDHKEGVRYIVDPYLDDAVEGLRETTKE